MNSCSSLFSLSIRSLSSSASFCLIKGINMLKILNMTNHL